MSNSAALDEALWGYLQFDYYVVAHWNPNSPLSRQQQHRKIVESWLRLGRYGRNKTPGIREQADLDHVDPRIPRDLQVRMDRNWDGNMVSVFWIRTWYGRKDDQESQDTADAGYKRLQYAALHIGNEEEPDEVLQEELFFDNKEEFGFDAEGTPKGDENVDFVNGVARGTPGSVPSYLITALMHYPNSFDGISERYWWNHSPEEIEAETPFMNVSQNMLILVADREACEEGWVLHLSVNHKGEVLPFKVRDRASCVYQSVANWMEGQPLNENAFCDMNVEYYQSDGDGWNPDYVLC